MKNSGFLSLAVAGLLWLVASEMLTAQDESAVLYEGKNGQTIWYGFSDVENSLYRHLNAEVLKLLEQRQEQVELLKGRQDWEMRQEAIRMILMEAAGPFPEKTPLHAQITGIVEKERFRIEHIVFESRPGFHVTSSLFIPSDLIRKAPAIILCSGHTAGAYRSSAYLHEILNYVSKGFIVYAFDPVAQGERLGYYDPETDGSRLKKATHEHSYAGAQAFVTGTSLAGIMAWDGIRALDYLLTRREVDPERIGITGRSGGGLQTALIAALDDRIRASAPECFITNMEMVFKIIGPQDAEQNIPGFISRGLDHADLLIARIPSPTLLVATVNDFFSIHGARETAREVKQVYRLFGAEGNFSMVEDMGIHSSTCKNREGKYAFFQKHLHNPGNCEDEETETLTAEELRVTPTGQVVTSYGSGTVYDLNRETARQLQEKLRKSRQDPVKHREKVLREARVLSGYRNSESPVKAVYAGKIIADSRVTDKYYIQGEGDYPVPFWLIFPKTPARDQLVIYLHPKGKSQALKEDSIFSSLLDRGYTILAPDLLGTGETGPGVYRGDSYINGVSYNLFFGSVLLGRSISGIRAGDINRLVSWAVGYLAPQQIYCIANGYTAPEALHAALFNTRIDRLALIHPFSSFRAVVMEEYYRSDYVHSLVPAALTAYDLPDLAAAFAPRELFIYGPVDAGGNLSSDTLIEEDMDIVRSGYSSEGVPDKLCILKGGDEDEPLLHSLIKWF